MAKYIDVKKAEDVLTIKAAQDRDSARRTWARAITALVDVPAADVEPVQRWIPITDGLPEEEGQYLVSCDSDFAIEVARFYIDDEDDEEDRWFGCDWNDPEDIVAWMPLPEPYKGGEDE